MIRCRLTQTRLRVLLDYDPETGIFLWKTSEGAKKAGTRAGALKGHGYRLIRVSGVFHYEHRLAFLWMNGELPPQQVDHVNGNRADNRWDNLRLATNAENAWNQPVSSRSRSGVKGVWRTAAEPRRWQSQIQIHGHRICLGSFRTREKAAAAYQAAAKRLHGEYFKL